MEKLTADVLVSLTGAILSLLAFYIPPFRRWLEEQVGDWKFAFMAGALLLVAAGYTAAWCSFAWLCIQAEAWSMLLVWFAALFANQLAYKAVVQPAKKIEFRRIREADAIARLRAGL